MIISINNAVQQLKHGNLVITPTETVYGLVADPENINSVKKLYLLKKRDLDQPFTIHVSHFSMIAQWADLKKINNTIKFKTIFERLILKFWPGPLTLILPRLKSSAYRYMQDSDKIGIRWPSHPLAQQLINQFGQGLIMTSVNYSKQPSAITAEQALKIFADQNINIDLIDELDKNKKNIKIYNQDSTVIDFDIEKNRVKIKREGAISNSELLEYLNF